MADADKPQQPKGPPSTTKKKTKAQTAAMKEQMAKTQELLQAQRQSLEALQKKKAELKVDIQRAQFAMQQINP